MSQQLDLPPEQPQSDIPSATAPDVRARIERYFGTGFADIKVRRSYYEHTEAFVKANLPNPSAPPDTDALGLKYWNLLRGMDSHQFAFLLLVSGYIPEFYEADSIQEKLYTKLVEIIAAEWGRRAGFDQTSIQRQKSSKEDVTFRQTGNVIVSDVKCYRLGRSQAAPNVKDTLKKADYGKWLEPYPKAERVGGIITFPSLFRWKGASDAYLYCTDHEQPIALTLYEHLTFILVRNVPSSAFVNHLRNYKAVFPTPSKSQMGYFTAMDKSLFGEKLAEWETFKKDTAAILQERVEFSEEKISAYLQAQMNKIKTEVAAMKVEEIRPKLVDSMYAYQCSGLNEQLKNIMKFRKPGTDI